MPVRKLVQITPSDLADGQAREGILREVCDSVADFDSDLAALARDLADTLLAHPVAIGLAAPQIGVKLRVAAINVKRDPGETLILVNPEILSITGKKDAKRESCMSLPDYAGEVSRKTKISVRYMRLDGKPTHVQAEGFTSRVIQHELDHLDGHLYTSRMQPDATLVPVDIFKYDAPEVDL